MFDWLNILTIMISLACLLFGAHFFRLTRKTPEGKMVSLFQDSVKVSRTVHTQSRSTVGLLGPPS
jgi:hypothetical protein